MKNCKYAIGRCMMRYKRCFEPILKCNVYPKNGAGLAWAFILKEGVSNKLKHPRVAYSVIEKLS